MKRFRYRAYDPSGKLVNGSLDADGQTEALAALAAQGLTPFAIEESRGSSMVPWWAREVTLFGDAIPRRALAQFFRSLALLLDARLPLGIALRDAMEGVSDHRLSALLSNAHREITEGQRLAEALKGHATIVPPRFVALVRVGEDSNRLADVTARAASLLERELSFRDELRAALVYPLILLFVSLLVLFGMLFLLGPQLTPVFSALGAEPPFFIRTLMILRGFLVNHGVFVLVGIGLCSLLTVLFLRHNRLAMQQLLLRMPFIGQLLKAAESSRSMLTLSMMLESGAPLMTALAATREAVTLDAYRKLFSEIEDKVLAGASLAEALGETSLIPRLARQMIRVGETGDRMGEMLENAGHVLDSHVRGRTQRFLHLLTPALTLVIGGVVGTLVHATLSAILELNDLAF